MTNELKQLIKDAAKLLDIGVLPVYHEGMECFIDPIAENIVFDPLDPERGDLMKVAEAAGLVFGRGLVTNAWSSCYTIAAEYTKDDYQSKALAILRAASAVIRAR